MAIVGDYDRILLVKDPHATSILKGKKLWEIRSTRTKVRGRVGIAKSGTGLVFGTVEVTGCIGPLSLDELTSTDNLPPSEHEMFRRRGKVYEKPHAWVLKDAVLFDDPQPFVHPQGAVIWVTVGTTPDRNTVSG